MDLDPITSVLNTIYENKYATEAQIKEIGNRVKAQVEESVKFAEESPLPDASELYKDVYMQEDYPFVMD